MRIYEQSRDKSVAIPIVEKNGLSSVKYNGLYNFNNHSIPEGVFTCFHEFSLIYFPGRIIQHFLIVPAPSVPILSCFLRSLLVGLDTATGKVHSF
jgi:hypothetical protein